MLPSSIPFRARKLKRAGVEISATSDAEQHEKKRFQSATFAEEDIPSVPETLKCQIQAAVEETLKPTTGVSETLTSFESVAAAKEHLKACDAKLRSLIEANPELVPTFKPCDSPFRSLARSIVFQQLATNAAATIYKRLLDLCGGVARLTPVTVSQLSQSQLRTVGISARKASYLHDLSRHFLDGSLSDTGLMVMEDDKLMSALRAVKGIGIWSVNMFMIFDLHKPDVLPIGDLGVRKGLSKLYDLKTLPTPDEMERIAAPWRPYRSLGSWYMWQLTDIKVPF